MKKNLSKVYPSVGGVYKITGYSKHLNNHLVEVVGRNGEYIRCMLLKGDLAGVNLELYPCELEEI